MAKSPTFLSFNWSAFIKQKMNCIRTVFSALCFVILLLLSTEFKVFCALIVLYIVRIVIVTCTLIDRKQKT